MTPRKTSAKRQSARKKSKTPSKGKGEARKKKSLKLLEELTGIGAGIWNEDAQEYVNRLRE